MRRFKLPYKIILLCALGIALKAHSATPPPQRKPPTAPTSLLAATDEIARQVSAIRRLAIRRTIARGIADRKQIAARLKERLHEEFTADELAIESQVLVRLGLLPDGINYEETIYALLLDQVAGFYDPFVKTLYIADWLALDLQRPALAHEITHALQDQHFDLKKYIGPFKSNSDQQLARTAVVEGDGTLSMLAFQSQLLGAGAVVPKMAIDLAREQMAAQDALGSAAFKNAPTYLRESLLFPYNYGLGFVFDAYQKKSWAAVDALFAAPPVSTEQVLHPEKYANRELPVALHCEKPLPALAGAIKRKQDVLGEFGFRLWFSLSGKEPKEISRAAAGWGGDCLVAYAAGAEQKELILAIFSVWDTDVDAREAEATLDATLATLTSKSGAPGTWQKFTDGKILAAFSGLAGDQLVRVAREVEQNWLDSSYDRGAAATDKVSPANIAGQRSAKPTKP